MDSISNSFGTLYQGLVVADNLNSEGQRDKQINIFPIPELNNRNEVEYSGAIFAAKVAFGLEQDENAALILEYADALDGVVDSEIHLDAVKAGVEKMKESNDARQDFLEFITKVYNHATKKSMLDGEYSCRIELVNKIIKP